MVIQNLLIKSNKIPIYHKKEHTTFNFLADLKPYQTIIEFLSQTFYAMSSIVWSKEQVMNNN